MPLFQRFISVCFCAIVTACASNAPQTKTMPDDGPQTGTAGGPPWLLPPGPRSNTRTAALPPDIAIPLEGLAGSWSGGRLGAKLTAQLRSRMIDLTQIALNQGQSGKQIKWRDGKLVGTIIPQVSFAGPSALDCREFHQTLRFEDVVETGYATACLAPDGSWRLLSE